jgi:hypothetical protein
MGTGVASSIECPDPCVVWFESFELGICSSDPFTCTCTGPTSSWLSVNLSLQVCYLKDKTWRYYWKVDGGGSLTDCSGPDWKGPINSTTHTYDPLNVIFPTTVIPCCPPNLTDFDLDISLFCIYNATGLRAGSPSPARATRERVRTKSVEEFDLPKDVKNWLNEDTN